MERKPDAAGDSPVGEREKQPDFGMRASLGPNRIPLAFDCPQGPAVQAFAAGVAFMPGANSARAGPFQQADEQRDDARGHGAADQEADGVDAVPTGEFP